MTEQKLISYFILFCSLWRRKTNLTYFFSWAPSNFHQVFIFLVKMKKMGIKAAKNVVVKGKQMAGQSFVLFLI